MEENIKRRRHSRRAAAACMLTFKFLFFSGLVPYALGYPSGSSLYSLHRRQTSDETFTSLAGCEADCQEFHVSRTLLRTCLDEYTTMENATPETCCTSGLYSSFQTCTACMLNVQPDSLDRLGLNKVMTRFNDIISKCNEGDGEDIPFLSLQVTPESTKSSMNGGTMFQPGTSTLVILAMVGMALEAL